MCLAQKLAEDAHRDQKYGAKPYVWHLKSVVDLLKEYKLSHLEDAAWLHDVLEDTKTTFFDLIHAGVPLRTVYLVHLVTKGQETSSEEYYRQISLSESAIQLKLADRICNVLESKENSSTLYKKYKKEFYVFMKYCYSPNQADVTNKMWNELAELFV